MKDIYNYDYLTITVKPDIEQDALQDYACFAWEVCERQESRKAVCIVLRRPHVIPDKDRLQLLQINLEKAKSDVIKYSKRKHTFIKVFAIYMWLFGLISILAGLSVAIGGGSATTIVMGVVFTMLGLGVAILTGVFFKRLIISERRNFELRTQSAVAETECALDEAKRLTYGG